MLPRGAGSVAHLPGGDDFARAVGVHCGHYAGHFHGFDHAGGAVVADFQFALHSGNRGAAAFEHESHGFVVKRIGFSVVVTATAAALKAATGFFDAVEDVVVVFRRAAQLPGLHHAVHFIVRYERAMHPNRQAGAWRHVEHVTVAQQLLGTALVDDGSRVDLARHLERHARRDVGLDQTGDHIHRRTLGGEDQVDTGGTGLLGDTCDQFFKPVSKEGTERLARKALQYVVDNDRDSLTIVHKGNIMKFTEGAFKEWAYGIAEKEFGATLLDGGPWMQFKNPKTGKNVVVKDAIADAMLQQILLRPAEYDVIATLNLNGDYLSDALAAEVGGIGIAPGANLSDTVAMFEATHGTAPKYAGKDQVNPGSLILSAEMMLRHLGWTEAADLIIKGTNGAISAKTVTYDFERLMEGAKLVSSSGFGDALISHM